MSPCSSELAGLIAGARGALRAPPEKEAPAGRPGRLVYSPGVARTVRTTAVLLRAVAYGESDRIVTLLSADHGRVSAIARGARRSAKRFAGSLEPYALIEVELALGKGELGRLQEARLVRAFPGILRDLGRMSVAAAGLELVRLATPAHEPPDPRLLPAVTRFFELAEGSASEELRLAFALRLFALVGLAPNFEHCGRCSRPAPEGRAALFDASLGAIVCRACGGGPYKLAGVLRRALAAATTRAFDEVATMDLGPAHRRAAAEAIDAFAEHHLGRHLAASDAVSQVREVLRVYGRASVESTESPESVPQRQPEEER